MVIGNIDIKTTKMLVKRFDRIGREAESPDTLFKVSEGEKSEIQPFLQWEPIF